jgi:hypothetical protein
MKYLFYFYSGLKDTDEAPDITDRLIDYRICAGATGQHTSCGHGGKKDPAGSGGEGL